MYCSFVYDGTGLEELYQFTSYPVSLFTYWGICICNIFLDCNLILSTGLNADLGESALNQTSAVQSDVLVKPNITIVNDNYGDFYHMVTSSNYLSRLIFTRFPPPSLCRRFSCATSSGAYRFRRAS